MGSRDSILNIILNIVNKGSGSKEAYKDIKALKGQVSDLGMALLGPAAGFMTLSGAVMGTIGFLKQCNDAAAAAELVSAQLSQTLESTGKAAQVSMPQLEGWASALAKTSTFDDESLMGAEAVFLRLQNVDPRNMESVLKATMDFAAGTNTQIGPASETLAKAFETGQTRALGFDKALQKQIADLYATGRQAEGLTLIMDTLNEKFGGQASAALDTYSGKTQKLKNDWENLMEAIGGGTLEEGKGAVDTIDFLVVATENYVKVTQTLTKAQQDGMVLTVDAYRDGRISLQQYNAALDKLNISTEIMPRLNDSATQSYIAMAQAQEGAGQAAQNLSSSQYDYLATAEAVAAGVRGDLANAWETHSQKVADLNVKLAETVQKYGEGSAQAAALRGEMDKLGASYEETTAKIIYQQVVKQMDAATSLEAARALGILSEADYETQMAVQNLTAEFDANNDGIVQATENGILYAQQLALVQQAIEYLRQNNQPITQEYILDYITNYESRGNPPGGGAPPPPVVTTKTGAGNTTAVIRGLGGPVEPNAYLWNENLSSRPEVFVSGGGYILTKQDAMNALGGGGSAGVVVQIVLYYQPLTGALGESEVRNTLLPVLAPAIRDIMQGRG